MSKQSSALASREKKKAVLVGVVLAVLGVANVLPLHYAGHGNCPHGGVYQQNGITMGVPLAYYRTVQGGIGECPDMVGESSASVFSAQALLTDALVFGVVAIGMNVLVDRRTNK